MKIHRGGWTDFINSYFFQCSKCISFEPVKPPIFHTILTVYMDIVGHCFKFGGLLWSCYSIIILLWKHGFSSPIILMVVMSIIKWWWLCFGGWWWGLWWMVRDGGAINQVQLQQPPPTTALGQGGVWQSCKPIQSHPHHHPPLVLRLYHMKRTVVSILPDDIMQRPVSCKAKPKVKIKDCWNCF